MATFDSNLGMWRANTGGYFQSEAEATAEDAAAAGGGLTSSDQDFARNGPGAGDLWQGMAPKTEGPKISRTQATASNAAFRGGFTDLNRDSVIDERDEKLANTPFGTPISQGGTAQGWQTQKVQLGKDAGGGTAIVSQAGDYGDFMPDALDARGPQRWVPSGAASYTQYDANGNLILSGGSTSDGSVGLQQFGSHPGGTAGHTGATTESLAEEQARSAATRTDIAGEDVEDTNRENTKENDNLFSGVMSRINALGGGDYGMSDEARGYQKEGLQQQRMLLEKMLGFDPNQYSTRYADQALSRQIAAGRSAGGGYASQQAGMFAAMEQAPQLYAEGARQASALENQRLQMAETAAKSFGDLGTMTRGQDEGRQQFESTLQVSIASLFNDAVGGKMQMNEQESQRMTEVWMDFADLQSRYDQMSSDEQLHQLDLMMQQKGLDQQWKMFKSEQAAAGAITSKDLIGGFFQLGGGAISALGTYGAATAGKPAGRTK